MSPVLEERLRGLWKSKDETRNQHFLSYDFLKSTWKNLVTAVSSLAIVGAMKLVIL